MYIFDKELNRINSQILETFQFNGGLDFMNSC